MRRLRRCERVVLENLPEGYEEIMDFGMIAYVVPLSVVPKTYNGHPLMYAADSFGEELCVGAFDEHIRQPGDAAVVCGQLQGDGEADEHGEVLREVQEAGGPAAGADWGGGGENADGGLDCGV